MTLLRLLIVLSIFSGVLFVVHFYVWHRTVRAAHLPRRWHIGLTTALFALWVAIPGLFLLRDNWPRAVVSPVSWVAYTWMGILFYLFVFALVTDFARGLWWTLRRLGGARGDDGADAAARRLRVRRAFAGAVAACAFLVAAGGVVHATRFIVRDVSIPIPDLPAAAEGYVIAHLTDIHIGPTIGRGYVDRVVRETNALGADMVVITGDLVDGTVDALRSHAEPLGELRARDGVWFVTGNHEYYAGPDPWIAHLETLGIRTLRNERVNIRNLFDLAGIDDAKALGMAPGHGPDLARALEGRIPARPLVLIAHQPLGVDAAAEAGVDLQLSGHAHGGQIVPFNWLVKLEMPYVNGLYRYGKTDGPWIYVNPGTGYWGPPMRVGTTSEIARIRLTRNGTGTRAAR